MRVEFSLACGFRPLRLSTHLHLPPPLILHHPRHHPRLGVLVGSHRSGFPRTSTARHPSSLPPVAQVLLLERVHPEPLPLGPLPAHLHLELYPPHDRAGYASVDEHFGPVHTHHATRPIFCWRGFLGGGVLCFSGHACLGADRYRYPGTYNLILWPIHDCRCRALRLGGPLPGRPVSLRPSCQV